MNFAEATDLILARMLTRWRDGSGNLLTPVQFEEEPIDPPETGYAQLRVAYQNRRQVTLGAPGNRKFEGTGLAVIILRTQPGIGVALENDLMDAAVRVFEGTRIAGETIRFGSAIPRQFGSDTRWRLNNVETGFDFEDLK